MLELTESASLSFPKYKEGYAVPVSVAGPLPPPFNSQRRKIVALDARSFLAWS